MLRRHKRDRESDDLEKTTEAVNKTQLHSRGLPSNRITIKRNSLGSRAVG